ncbi:MAG: hypothetical protein IJV24_05290, partial [Prevotella sp.]|nr:hypothetical protein [Prevotella sp.]
ACVACGAKADRELTEAIEKELYVEGDSTIYGLACDGCTDTIVVFLRSPYEGHDPDTLNILEASRLHHVFGVPRIGDKLALVRNAQDSTKADIVIVTEDFQGLWCYKVLPTLRQHAGMDHDSHAAQFSVQPDSLEKLLAIEHEYGFQIKAEGVAVPIGMRYRQRETADEQLVEYPEGKRYREWHIFNGRLLLTETGIDSVGNIYQKGCDTAEFVALTPDTLVLRFADGLRGFYRKAEEQKDEAE